MGALIDLGRLLRNIFPPRDRRRWIVVMEAYGDASFFGGTGQYAVAAFLAPANDWARLQIQWRRALREADPDLRVFHMTDFMSPRSKIFGSWSQPKKDRLLRKLLRVISDNVTYGCAGIMTTDGYKTMLQLHEERTEKGLPTLGTNAYALCADSCIGVITGRLSVIAPSKRVAYFFEAGDQGLPELRHTVNIILAKSPQYREDNRILSLTTVSKAEAPALQTADLLAYEFTHCQSRELTANLQALVSFVPMHSVYLDEALLCRGTEGYTPDVLNELMREHNLRPRQKRRRRGNS